MHSWKKPTATAPRWGHPSGRRARILLVCACVIAHKALACRVVFPEDRQGFQSFFNLRIIHAYLHRMHLTSKYIAREKIKKRKMDEVRGRCLSSYMRDPETRDLGPMAHVLWSPLRQSNCDIPGKDRSHEQCKGLTLSSPPPPRNFLKCARQKQCTFFLLLVEVAKRYLLSFVCTSTTAVYRSI